MTRPHPDLHPGAHVFTSHGALAVCMSCRIAIRPGVYHRLPPCQGAAA